MPNMPRTAFGHTHFDPALPCAFADATPLCACAAAGANNGLSVSCSRGSNPWPASTFAVKLSAAQGVSPCNDVEDASTYITVVDPPTVNINGPGSGSVCNEDTKTFQYTFSPSDATVTASANNNVNCNQGEMICRVRSWT
jgi:hypothetical protein